MLRPMELAPASPALGTTVRGVDLRAPLPAADVDVLRRVCVGVTPDPSIFAARTAARSGGSAVR
jgi:hypothetical protein